MLHLGSYRAIVLVLQIRRSFSDPLEAKGLHDRYPRLSFADCGCCSFDCGTVGSRHLSSLMFDLTKLQDCNRHNSDSSGSLQIPLSDARLLPYHKEDHLSSELLRRGILGPKCIAGVILRQ